jgi:hypothetical protein
VVVSDVQCAWRLPNVICVPRESRNSLHQVFNDSQCNLKPNSVTTYHVGMIRSNDQNVSMSSFIVTSSQNIQRVNNDHDVTVLSMNETNTIDDTRAITYTTISSSYQYRIRTILLILLSITIILIIVDTRTTKYIETFSLSFMDWLSIHPVFGIFVVILVYIVATILFIPGSILTIGVGYAFQHAFYHNTFLAVLCSSIAVFVGASFGSIICFLLGRYLFRDAVMRLANRYQIFCAIDRGA